ncbi:MAG: serine hydrolase domain-containing protein [Caulobacteraceae bacterium]
MRLTRLMAALAAAIGVAVSLGAAGPAGHATALRPQGAPTSIAPTASVGASAVAGGAAHPLTADDVNAWLDGYMPYALKSGDIAGAVVVVVKDGQVLTERGYGYSDVKTHAPVDPKSTLFRPGSISKLFTWTAVMQLVQAGKIDLDADVNRYLDFRIPPYQGKPVTMRELLTHSAGFEEDIKHLITSDPKQMLSLGAYIKSWVPTRFYTPGSEVAYSNYGAALAGYIVQRVSGEPFDAYVAHHIFQPLDMTNSTFVQPLPPTMAAHMSKGYPRASLPPKPFEIITAAPAGALTTTGDDMTRFMIAQLNNGAFGQNQILDAKTAVLMHAPALTPIPHLSGYALGFYHEDRNGQVIIGHGGDTDLFHSDLALFLNQDVGYFISVNSAGRAGAAEPLRVALLREFTDRYFPAPAQASPPTWPTAKKDAAAMAGAYISDRRSNSDFMRIVSLLSRAQVVADPDGTIKVSAFKTVGGAVKTWREIGPFYWVDAGGESHLAARLVNGRVAGFLSDDLPPVLQFQPAPAWTAPIPLLVCFGLMVLLALQWPIAAINRAWTRRSYALTGAPAWGYRLVRVSAWVEVALVVGWAALVLAMLQNLNFTNDPIDPWLRLMQVVSVLGVIAIIPALWNLVLVWRDGTRSWFAKLCSLVWVLAIGVIIWYIVELRLLTFSLHF